MSGATTIQTLLGTYPRTRPPLTPAHEAIFAAEYQRNREGRGSVLRAASGLEAWMHRRVARGSGARGPVLEIGAGTLNHLPFEPAAAREHYDIVEPMRYLVDSNPAALAQVRGRFESIADVPTPARGGVAYARVVSIAVLEHMTDLPAEVARCVVSLREDGLFQAGIPSEGGLAWYLAWRCVTGTAYRLRTGLDYRVVMRHEHVNTAADIKSVLGHFFERLTLRRFPLPMHHLSFYTYLEAAGPRVARAQEYLAARGLGTDECGTGIPLLR